MCTYKTLHHSKEGYIIKCSKCKHIQVAFGTTAMSLSHEQFYEFKEAVNLYYYAHEFAFCRSQKVVHIPTALNSVILIYSVDELETLSDMLNEASLGLEIEQLITVDTEEN